MNPQTENLTRVDSQIEPAHDSIVPAAIIEPPAASAPDTPAATAPKVASGLYIYGVCPAIAVIPADLLGLGDQPVRTLREGGLVAVISDAPAGRLRPERRLLAAHQRVVQALARACDVLPTSFGTVASSVRGVKDLLTLNDEMFTEQLEHIRGRCEMTLRLSLGVENVFAHLVSLDPELRHYRDAIAAGDTSHDTKMAAGRCFERVLANLREQSEQRVRAVVEPISDEVASPGPRNEKELVNFSVMIPRGHEGSFEKAIHDLAAEFDDHHVFDHSGPWACHSFVDLRITMPKARKAG